MDKLTQFLAVREGGQTVRAHVMPYVGTYTVATHSFNALNLLLLLYPGAPSHNLIKAVMWHDVPERWTGDVPAPAKWYSPELKRLLDQIEEKILIKFGLNTPFNMLTPEEIRWLNGVDLLELFIWGCEQKAMGNYAAADLIDRVTDIFEQKQHFWPAPIIQFHYEFDWRRIEECNTLLEGL